MSLARSLKHAVFSAVAGVESLVRHARFGRGESLAGTRNFLLLQFPTALGPAIHATPLVAGLREAMPACRIVVAASGLATEVFRNNPHVDRLIETPSPLRNLRAAARSLRRERPFDGEPFAALTTCGNERTLIGLQGLLSGAAMRVGFTEVPELYCTALKVDPQLSLIDNNLRIVQAFGRDVRHFEPQIFVAPHDVAAARQMLQDSGIQHLQRDQHGKKDQPLAVFVTQNSGGQRTGWYRERFVRVIRHAADMLGCAIVYVGTSRDAAAVDEIRQAAGGVGVSLVGKTTVTQLAAVLALSDAVVTLDTGTMHVGRAMQVPMVVLGPSWQKPIEWLPLQLEQVRILRGKDRDTVPADYQLDEITAEGVIAALEDLLRCYPPSLYARTRRLERSLRGPA